MYPLRPFLKIPLIVFDSEDILNLSFNDIRSWTRPDTPPEYHRPLPPRLLNNRCAVRTNHPTQNELGFLFSFHFDLQH